MKNKIYLKTYKYLCVAIFFLIVLGGSVRAANAGLACPDWPLCFGDFVPDFHPQVYFEFIHRALAGLIGIVSVLLNGRLILDKGIKKGLRWTAAAAILILIAQVIMGGLTVLLRLQDKVVALHLALGTAFFAISLWIYFSQKFQIMAIVLSEQLARAKSATGILLTAIYVQIILGGLVASNYAGQVCPDFPLCHGQFIPTLQGTIGLHIIHRLGAYALATIILCFFIYVKFVLKIKQLSRATNWILILLVVQITIGIVNVLYLTPPLITVKHLATGVLLLAVATYMHRLTTYLDAPQLGSKSG